MEEWWMGLSTVLRVMYCLAIPSTLILLIQIIMTIFGFGEGGGGVNPSDVSGLDMPDIDVNISDVGTDLDLDLDLDSSSDGGNPADFGALKLFTFQGIIAFIAVFSWFSITCISNGIIPFLGIILGIIVGGMAMFAVAKIMSLSQKLSENGTLQLKNALGESGTVYLTIPKNGEGVGKITLNVQGRFVELEAVTDDAQPIKTGSAIRVIDLRGDVLVVELEK